MCLQIKVAEGGVIGWLGSWKAGRVIAVKYTEGGQGWRAELKVRRQSGSLKMLGEALDLVGLRRGWDEGTL